MRFSAEFRKREGSRLVAGPQAEASHAARMLALAYWIDRQVQSGAWKDYREAARRLGVSHARVSQLTGLLLVPPVLQARILLGKQQFMEQTLRQLAAERVWNQLR